MKFPVLTCLSVVTLLCTSAQAWVGGPFSNNSFDNTGNINGTYQGVLRADGVIGVMVLGMSATQEFKDTGMSQISVSGTGNNATATYTQLYNLTGNEGRFAMFVRGSVVAGTASGSVDMAGRKISAVIEGSRNRGSKSVSTTITTTGTDGSVSSQAKNFTLNDILHVSGNFEARINRMYPVQRFQGQGDLYIVDPNGVEPKITADKPVLSGTKTSLPDGSTATSYSTSYVPSLNEPGRVALSVYGLKTSDQQPYFRSALTVQYPSVE